MPQLIVATQNYLVPADGKTSCYLVRETLVDGVPLNIDFRNVNLDGQEFWPYGVYINNLEGTKQCDVVIDQMFLTISTPAGEDKQKAYPGPVNQTVTITGEGPVTLLFVNYPIV